MARPYVTISFETSRKSRIPFTLLGSKVSRCVLFNTNSAVNLSSGVVTCGSSANVSIARSTSGVCRG